MDTVIHTSRNGKCFETDETADSLLIGYIRLQTIFMFLLAPSVLTATLNVILIVKMRQRRSSTK